MKKILNTLVIIVYFVPISLFLTSFWILTQETQELKILSAYIIPMILMITVCILAAVNIVAAIHSLLRSRSLSFRTVMVRKLYLTPFYIIIFIFWMIAPLIFRITIMTWHMVPFIIACAYFIMIGTSVHIIAKLIILHKRKIITAKQFIVHFIFQIVFAADVVGSITLAIEEKNGSFTR